MRALLGVARLSLCIQGISAMSIMNGYGGQEMMDTLREERRAEMAQLRLELVAPLEEAAAECSSVRRDVERIQSMLEAVEEALENKTAKAMREFESLGAAAKTDAELLRREMAEVAGALESRIARKFVETAKSEEEERQTIVERLEARLDISDNQTKRMNMSIAVLSTAVMNQSQRLDLEIEATEIRANATALQVSKTQRKEIEALLNASGIAIETRLLQEINESVFNLSSVDSALKINHTRLEDHIANMTTELLSRLQISEHEFTAFRDEALNWTAAKENDLSSIASNLTKLDIGMIDLHEQQLSLVNSTENKLKTLGHALHENVTNLMSNHNATITKKFDSVLGLSDALNASLLQVAADLGKRVNFTQQELDTMRLTSLEFSALSYNWSTATETQMRDIAIHLEALEAQVGKREKEVEDNLNAVRAEVSSHIETEVHQVIDLFSVIEKNVNSTKFRLEAKANQSQTELTRLDNEVRASIERQASMQSLALADALERIQVNISSLETQGTQWTSIATQAFAQLENTSKTHSVHLERLDQMLQSSNSMTTTALSRLEANETALRHKIHTVESSLSENLVSMNSKWDNNFSVFLEAAALWSQDVEARLEAHSTATVALDLAINATATAVDAEVAARRRDSARFSSDTERLDATATNTEQALSDLNHTTATQFSRLEESVNIVAANASASLALLQDEVDSMSVDTSSSFQEIKTRIAAFDLDLKKAAEEAQISADSASAWAAGIERRLADADTLIAHQRADVAVNYSRLDAALRESRTENRETLASHTTSTLRLIDDLKDRVRSIDASKPNESVVAAISSRLDAVLDTRSLAQIQNEELSRQLDERLNLTRTVINATLASFENAVEAVVYGRRQGVPGTTMP